MMKKDLSLEGLRGVAALAVFLAHFVAAFLPYSVRGLFRGGDQIQQRFWWEDLISNPVVNLLMNGTLAVQIFFVLSGYVLTKRYFENDDHLSLRIGATKRYSRLTIPVLASCVLVWLLSSLGWMGTALAPAIGAAGWPMVYYAAPIGLREAVEGSLFSIPFRGVGTDINSPLWTMHVEMVGSFLLFGAYILCGKAHPLRVAGVFLLALLVIKAGDWKMIWFVALLAGSFIHYFAAWLKRNSLASLALGLVGFVVGAFSYSPAYAPLHQITLPELGWPLFDLEKGEVALYTGVGAFLIVCGVIGSRPMGWIFARRIPVYLGKISFSLYLLHWPIICSLSYALMHTLILGQGWAYEAALAVTFIVSLSACLGASHLMARHVDEFAIGISGRFAQWCWRNRAARPD